MGKEIQFSERQAKEMAEFIAALENNLIEYDVIHMMGGWKITVLGKRTGYLPCQNQIG